ncbi:MAG: hypothetical protein ACAH59_06030 [Pseudobdellovibrionaceae bacterium]
MFLLFVSMMSSVSFAQEVRENYLGTRALGMGGASIAVVNDETALLINPAGLGKLRDIYGTIFDPEVEGSSNLKKMYDTKAFTDPFDLEQVKNTTDYSRDTYYHAKAQVFPSFVVRNFGIGIHAKRVLDAQMNTAGTSLQTFYQEDVSLNLGFNLRLFDGRIKMGVVGKAISRIELNDDLDPATSSMDIKALASEGFGIGYDAGLILTAPIVWLPTITGVIRDIGDTAFTAGSGLRMVSETRPETVKQDIDVAFAVFPIHTNKSRSQFTIQWDKLKASSEATDRSRFYHAGYEFNYADILFLRAGMNQKYWTGGIELAGEHTQIQIASYGEDVGVDGTPVEDRRFVFKFAFRF